MDRRLRRRGTGRFIVVLRDARRPRLVGGLWADRMTDSAIARQAVTEGLATENELREIADGWRRWAKHPDAWYAVLHGEILCRA
jgi:hypothetical protein